jgi:hypothetical protein
MSKRTPVARASWLIPCGCRRALVVTTEAATPAGFWWREPCSALGCRKHSRHVVKVTDEHYDDPEMELGSCPGCLPNFVAGDIIWHLRGQWRDSEPRLEVL